MKNLKKNLGSSVYVGVDIGVNGGISVINTEGELSLFTIPKVKTKVDYSKLISIFDGIVRDGHRELVTVYCCLEDVHSIYGMSAKSNFNFGFIKGFKVSQAISHNFIYELVPPKTWQKEIWTNSDKVYKGNKRIDTKATSLLAAKRLFPKEAFLATARSSKPHDGLVDAALIAEYSRRKFS